MNPDPAVRELRLAGEWKERNPHGSIRDAGVELPGRPGNSSLWPLALRGFPEVLDVGKIAEPSRGEF